jgi:hypothetical protein
MGDDEALEGEEMALLLFGHLMDGGDDAAAAEHGELTIIDAGSAVLAGMVDADHPRDRVGGR